MSAVELGGGVGAAEGGFEDVEGSEGVDIAVEAC